GDAGPVGALSPDQLALDQGDPEAALGEGARAVLARRAAAEDDRVVVTHPGARPGRRPCGAWRPDRPPPPSAPVRGRRCRRRRTPTSGGAARSPRRVRGAPRPP